MKKRILYTFIATTFLLYACSEEKQANVQPKEEAPKTEKIAVGTNIASLVKKQASMEKAAAEKAETEKAESNNEEYKKIDWEDLEIPGQGMAQIIEKFEKEIDSIEEGSIKEKEMMGRLQAALNSAPVNPDLNKKKIKLSGFVSPLEIDDKEGVVKEFLLVPYFGACIHVPPPPLNQTLLIKPAKDQQIKIEDAYEPIWVSGVIHAETTSTKLAEAGYKISDVKIEPYREHLQE